MYDVFAETSTVLFFKIATEVSKAYMGVSKNNGTPKSSILIGFSIKNQPFWGAPIFGNTYIFSMVSFSELGISRKHPGPPRNGTPERPFRVNLVGQQADQVGPDAWDNRLNSAGCNGTGHLSIFLFWYKRT